MVTADKVNHCLGIRTGGCLGLFTRSNLIGTGFFVAAMAISASAQTREQIAPMQAQIAARQAQKNTDLAISQRDALQAELEDTTLATIQHDSTQNQLKTGEAVANANRPHVVSAADQSQPQQEPQSATSEQAPASQNQAHRSPSEPARPPKIHLTRETKTRNSAASPRATPFISQLQNQWNRFWQRLKANP